MNSVAFNPAMVLDAVKVSNSNELIVGAIDGITVGDKVEIVDGVMGLLEIRFGAKLTGNGVGKIEKVEMMI